MKKWIPCLCRTMALSESTQKLPEQIYWFPVCQSFWWWPAPQLTWTNWKRKDLIIVCRSSLQEFAQDLILLMQYEKCMDFLSQSNHFMAITVLFIDHLLVLLHSVTCSLITRPRALSSPYLCFKTTTMPGRSVSVACELCLLWPPPMNSPGGREQRRENKH